MPDAVAEIVRKAPLTPEKVAFAWRLAVGPNVEKATTISLREDVLHVVAKGAPWQREIERNGAMVRARLASILGAGVVRRVHVTIQ
jgi:hypothetical protein